MAIIIKSNIEINHQEEIINLLLKEQKRNDKDIISVWANREIV